MLLAFGCRWQLSFQLPESCPILADENCDSCFHSAMNRRNLLQTYMHTCNCLLSSVLASCHVNPT